MHPDHRPLPAPVLQALESGHTIEAIKRLREAEGLGLKEAKDRVDALAASTGNGGSAGNLPGLAPGEQPHGSSALGWIVVALVTGVAAWYFFLQRAG